MHLAGTVFCYLYLNINGHMTAGYGWCASCDWCCSPYVSIEWGSPLLLSCAGCRCRRPAIPDPHGIRLPPPPIPRNQRPASRSARRHPTARQPSPSIRHRTTSLRLRPLFPLQQRCRPRAASGPRARRHQSCLRPRLLPPPFRHLLSLAHALLLRRPLRQPCVLLRPRPCHHDPRRHLRLRHL